MDAEDMGNLEFLWAWPRGRCRFGLLAPVILAPIAGREDIQVEA